MAFRGREKTMGGIVFDRIQQQLLLFNNSVKKGMCRNSHSQSSMHPYHNNCSMEGNKLTEMAQSDIFPLTDLKSSFNFSFSCMKWE